MVLGLIFRSRMSNGVFFLIDYLSARIIWLMVFGIGFSLMRTTYVSWLWLSLILVLSLRFIVLNLLRFFVFFELRLIPILLMIIYWGNQPERLSAGAYFLIYTACFSIPYIVIIIVIMPIGSFFLSREILNIRVIIVIVLFLPFFVKMPVFGLHFWLPKAHVEARTRGSIVLAGVLLKLGRYGIFRLSLLISIRNFKNTTRIWIFSSVLARLSTIIQSDVKKLVAYSSVSHMTFIIIGLVAFNKSTLLRVLLLSLAHGWASIAIFASAGILRHGPNSRLGFLLGRESKLHWVILLLGLTLLSNASLPPFPSFFPEVLIISLVRMFSIIVVLFMLVSIFVCYYNTYLYMWISHVKNVETIQGRINIGRGVALRGFVQINILTLIWIVYF